MVDPQEIELGDEVIPSVAVGCRRCVSSSRKACRGIRVAGELFQFTNLALDGDGELGPWP